MTLLRGLLSAAGAVLLACLAGCGEPAQLTHPVPAPAAAERIALALEGRPLA